MPTFGKRSTDNLGSCHGKLQLVCRELIKHYDFAVIEGYRPNDRQDELFHQRKSKLRGGQSLHNKNPSRAIDLAPYPIDWNDRDAGSALATSSSASGLALASGALGRGLERQLVHGRSELPRSPAFRGDGEGCLMLQALLPGLLPLLGDVLDRVLPDEAAREKAKLEMAKLQQQGNSRPSKYSCRRSSPKPNRVIPGPVGRGRPSYTWSTCRLPRLHRSPDARQARDQSRRQEVMDKVKAWVKRAPQLGDRPTRGCDHPRGWRQSRRLPAVRPGAVRCRLARTPPEQASRTVPTFVRRRSRSSPLSPASPRANIRRNLRVPRLWAVLHAGLKIRVSVVRIRPWAPFSCSQYQRVAGTPRGRGEQCLPGQEAHRKHESGFRGHFWCQVPGQARGPLA